MKKLLIILFLFSNIFAAEVNQDIANANTALLVAAKENNLDAVSDALKLGADVNAKDTREEYFYSALHHAAKNGNCDIVDLLVKAKADVEQLNGFKTAPLTTAVIYYKSEVVKQLVDFNANVNVIENGYTPLSRSIENKQNNEIMRILLDAKADPELAYSTGTLPIHGAASHGSIEEIKDLLKRIANVDATDGEGSSALYWAIILNRPASIIMELIKARADVNKRCSIVNFAGRTTYKTILDVAADNYELSKILLCNGASLLASQSKFRKKINIQNINKLFKLEENSTDIENFSAFIWSVLYEDLEKLNELCKLENLCDFISDKTPLMFAQKYDKKESIKFLLDKIVPVVKLIRTEICIPLPLAKLIGHYLFGTQILNKER